VWYPARNVLLLLTVLSCHDCQQHAATSQYHLMPRSNTVYVRILNLRVAAGLHGLVEVLTWKRFERLGVVSKALVG
jgi:hypothetical protein